MCIFFLTPECPFSPASDTTRKPSGRHSRSSSQSWSMYPSPGSSRSCSNSSAESAPSFKEALSSKTSCQALCESGLPINPYHPKASPAQQLREYLLSKDNKVVHVGRCVDPTSPSPLMCQNFQARHRPSPSNFAGFFEKCSDCSQAGLEVLMDLKENLGTERKREIEDDLMHEMCEMCGVVVKNVQFVKAATFESCGKKECEECKANGGLIDGDEK